MSRLDQLYRSILLTKYFTKGWGNPENIKRIFEFKAKITNRETCQHLVPSDYPIHIDKEEVQGDCRLLEGHFVSPLAHYLPDVVPKESRIAYFQMLLPKDLSSPLRPVCLHLAGTGDHYYWRRRTLLARPLLKETGIMSILLENPYYGLRKPKEQRRSSLCNVSDIFVMGGCLILESLALFHWCEREGFGPFGVTGISMGGHMASLAATNWHKPIALIPCLSWTTASCAFTQGVLSGAIPWKLLQSQYFSDSIYEDEIKKMLHSPEQNPAFRMGQNFAKNYQSDVRNMEQFHSDNYSQFSSTSVPNVVNLVGVDGTNVKLNATNMQMNIPDVSDLSSNKLETSPLKKNALARWRLKREDSLREEALHFMHGIMDECTHLANFSTPVDPSLVIVVAANHDAYIPREGVLSLTDIWPEAEIRYLDTGHISAFLFNQKVFRQAIKDSFDRLIEKHYSNQQITQRTGEVFTAQ